MWEIFDYLSVGPVLQKSESRDLIMALEGSKEKATPDTVNFEIDMNWDFSRSCIILKFLTHRLNSS